MLAVSVPSLVFVCTRKILGIVPCRPRWMIGTALIFTALAMRGLGGAAADVEHALREGRLERARTRLGPLRRAGHGGSFGIGRLQGRRGIGRGEHERRRRSPHALRRASRCAGALAYKAVNTLDSMVGYRHPPYEDLGWASARLDDLANLAPSRLTMLCIAAISGRPLRSP